ncbi:MAG TPA: PepSY-like domain-containing protein [Bacteroidia bacterium]|mgnify:CR=1 FL=1|nr:PepSY-like domain-containing protein [Bacteroidia bacterium]
MIKKQFRGILLSVVAIFISNISMSQDKVMTNSEIPAEIQHYVKTHFAQHTIARAEINKEGLQKEYEIKLNDRTQLEFNNKYQIIKIDADTALPQSVIPAKLQSYIKTNYPQNHITEWELDNKGQEIKLNNGIKLEFSKQGDFKRIDR